MHTRVSISSWSGHAVTGFAFPRSTLHFSKPGERGLVLQSNIYLCWKSSRETTPLGRYPLQRLCRHSWDGVVLGPNPFSFLLCNGTQMTLWAKSCSAKRPHSPALSAPGGATETQAEVTLWDIWSNSGAAFFQTPTWSPRRQPLALGNIKASGAGAGGAGRPLTVSAATPTLVGLPAALFYVWEKKKKNLSRTVKSPIFHPLHKITREPASFKDSGRRNETPRSETKEFTAHSTAHGHSCFPAPPSPVSSSPMGVGGIPGMQQLCIKAKEPQTQEIWFWGGGGGDWLWTHLSNLYLVKRRYLYYTARQTHLPCAPEGSTSSSKAVCNQYPGEDIPEQKPSVPLCTKHKKDPWRTPPHNERLFCLSSR